MGLEVAVETVKVSDREDRPKITTATSRSYSSGLPCFAWPICAIRSNRLADDRSFFPVVLLACCYQSDNGGSGSIRVAIPVKAGDGLRGFWVWEFTSAFVDGRCKSLCWPSD